MDKILSLVSVNYHLPAELWDTIAIELFKYSINDLIKFMSLFNFFRKIVLNNKSLNSKLEFISRCKRSNKSPLKKLKEAFYEGRFEHIEWIIKEYEMTIDASEMIYADITIWAFARGESRFIRWIIEKTYPSEIYVSESFLPEAAECGNLEIIQFLIDRANITYENSEDTINRALLNLCENSHLEVASWLVKRFNLADRNIKNIKDIIVMTCMLGGLDILEWLITTFKLPFSTIEGFLNKNYIFEEVCIYNNPKMAEWMLKTFNLTISHKDIISIFEKIHREDRLEIIEWLILTFNLTINDIKSSNIFQTACNNGYLKTVNCIIKVLNLNSEDIVDLCNYNVPLVKACRNGDLEFVQWIVETFKLTDRDIMGNEYNCKLENCDICWLVSTFESYKNKNINKNIFFWAACESGHLEVVKYLSDTFNLYINRVPSWNSEAKKKIVKHENILKFIEEKYGIDVKYEFRKALKAYKKEIKTWKLNGRRKGWKHR